MYGKEKTYRKQIRFKESVIKAAQQICVAQNRNFTNLLETLILKEYDFNHKPNEKTTPKA